MRAARSILAGILLALTLATGAGAHGKGPTPAHHWMGTVRVTQYTQCCIAASGHTVYYGEAAADPSIPFGAVVVVPNLGRFTVLDRGSAVYGWNHIDIWVPYFPRSGVKDYYANCYWFIPKAVG